MNNDKMREAFEADTAEWSSNYNKRDADGSYSDKSVDCAWKTWQRTWQAALASADSGKRQEPVAWAAFGVSGNIRIWTSEETKVHKLAAAVGQELLPLYLSSAVKDSLTASPAQGSKVPEGWRLWTDEMGCLRLDDVNTDKHIAIDPRTIDNPVDLMGFVGRFLKDLQLASIADKPGHPEQPLAMVDVGFIAAVLEDYVDLHRSGQVAPANRYACSDVQNQIDLLEPYCEDAENHTVEPTAMVVDTQNPFKDCELECGAYGGSYCPCRDEAAQAKRPQPPESSNE